MLIKKCKRDHVTLWHCQLYIKTHFKSYNLKMASCEPKHVADIYIYIYFSRSFRAS